MIQYPLFFNPVFKEKVWGGSKLSSFFSKDAPTTTIGESWEIAAHDHGASIIENGRYKNLSLNEVVRKETDALLGDHLSDLDKFPLLLKLIDAQSQLSVQVHPEDSYANLYENGEFGKSEAWYILHAEEDAKLVVGLKEGTTKEEFKIALEEERLEEVLKFITVKDNDVINIPAGLVHAIGAGIVIAEIQQNSDTTYRVYDWNRKDDKGLGRELHVDKALDVIDFEGKIPAELIKGHLEDFVSCKRTTFISNDYFSLEKYEIQESYSVLDKQDTFELYMCIEGAGSIQWSNGFHDISFGQSFLIPADLKSFKISGSLTLLRMCNKVGQ